MKYPSHILLDVKKSLYLYSSSWLQHYFTVLDTSTPLCESGSQLSLASTTQSADWITRLKIPARIKPFFKAQFTLTLIQLHRLHRQTLVLHAIFNSTPFSKTFDKKFDAQKNGMWFLFDINFLRNDRLTAKLKYSRSPQQDIVSGGVAALFAGFIGFLISEKFGIELVDSADFYTGLMYVVFGSFAWRAFFKDFGEVESKKMDKKNHNLFKFRVRRLLPYAPKTFYLDFFNFIITICTLLFNYICLIITPTINPFNYTLTWFLNFGWWGDFQKTFVTRAQFLYAQLTRSNN